MSEDNIEVAVRVRPVLKSEERKKLQDQWSICESEIYLTDPPSGCKEIFTFDYILDSQSTNQDLYAIVQPLVKSAITGFNATIFAYGQTSSGKTHSIIGNDCDPGIIPLAVHDIFDIIHSDTTQKFALRISYVEIYNEKINDLLNVANKDLRIREDIDGNLFINSEMPFVRNEEEMLETIRRGNKNRQIGETKMNERSSRSHVICDIIIESYDESNCENGEVESDTLVKVSHLYIVDLAGSERISQTGATGMRLNEGVHINKSLSALISVITQLSNGQSFVSFRDSKLTRLLSNALGGNSKTLIVAAVTPVSVDDTLSTLKFARSAKNIKNKPRINEIVNEQSIIKSHQAREKSLLKMLEESKQCLSVKDDTIKRLESELQEVHNIFVTKVEQTKPRKPSRRHTMGAVIPKTEVLAPILETSLTEIPDEPAKETNKISLSPTPDDICEYDKLRMQYDLLDQSHAVLKEFTQLELNVAVEEKTKELRDELLHVKCQLAQIKNQEADMQQKYQVLDVSHAALKEFTQLEMEIALEDRSSELRNQIAELKQQNVVLKDEIEIVKQLQQQQFQNRCAELLSRIEELESEKKPTTSSTSEDVNPLELSIRLNEMHSKFLKDESSAPKDTTNCSKLTRSMSVPNLLQKSLGDNSKKEIFQDIFKSLRRLCSTIVSDTKGKEASIQTLDSPKIANVSDDNIAKENEMLKESIGELLEKIKHLNDKLNAREITSSGVETYQMTIDELNDKIVVLERTLSDNNQKLADLNNELQKWEAKGDEQCILDMETKIGALEGKVVAGESQNTELKKQISDLLDNQTKYTALDVDLEEKTKCIEELRDELRKDKAIVSTNAIYIKELEKELGEIKQLHENETSKLSDLSLEFQQIKDHVTMLEHENKLLKESADKANSTIVKELREEIKLLETSVKEKSTDIQRLKDDLEENMRQSELSTQQLSEKSNEYQEACSKIKTLELKNEETVKFLQTIIEAKESALNDMHNDIQENLLKLQLEKDKTEHLSSEYKKALHLCQAAEKKEKKLAAEAQAHQEEIAALQQNINQLKVDLSNMDKNKLQSILEAKEREIIQLREELQEYEHKHSMNEHSFEALSREYDDAIGKITMLQEELQRSQGNSQNGDNCIVNELQQQIRQAKLANTNKDNELKSLKEDLNQEIHKAKQAEEKLNLFILDFDELEAKQKSLEKVIESCISLEKHEAIVAELSAQIKELSKSPTNDNESGELQEQLQAAIDHCIQKEDRLKELNCELDAMKEALDKCRDDRDEALSKLVKEQKALENFESAYRISEEKLSELQSELSATSARCIEQQQAFSRLQHEFDDMKNTLSNSESEKSEVLEKFGKEEKTLENLKHALQESQEKARGFELQLNETLKRCSDNEEQLHQLKQALHDSEEKAQIIELEHNKTCKLYAEKDASLKQMRQELDRIKDALTASESNKSEAQNKLAMEEKIYHQQKQLLCENEEKIEELKKEVIFLRADKEVALSNLQRELDATLKYSKQCTSQRNDAYAQIEDLKKELLASKVKLEAVIKEQANDLNAIREKRTDRIHELEWLLEQAEREQVSTAEQLKLSAERFAKLEDKNTGLELSLRQEKNRYAHLESKFDQFCVQKKQMLEEEYAKKIKNCEQEMENKQRMLEGDLDKAKREIREERERNMDLLANNRNSLQQVEINKLNAEVDQLRGAIRPYKNKVYQLAKQRDESQKQIAALQAEIEDKNTKLKQMESASNDLRPASASCIPTESENMQRLFIEADQELCSMLEKVSFITQLSNLLSNTANTCNLCTQLSDSFTQLHNTWLSNEELKELHHIQLVRPDYYKFLLKTRNDFRNLQSMNLNASQSEYVSTTLKYVTEEIEKYTLSMNNTKEKLKLLQQILEETLKQTTDINKMLQPAKCQQCSSSHYCCEILDALDTRIKRSIQLLEAYPRWPSAMHLNILSIRRIDTELDSLMTKLKEQPLTNGEGSSSLIDEHNKLKEKYKRAKRLCELRYNDVLAMKEVLFKENYEIDFKINPIKIIKKLTENGHDDGIVNENPRPHVGRLRDNASGRKSIGSTPRHLGVFFATPEEHKEAVLEARRFK